MTLQQVKEVLKHMSLAYAHISVLVGREGEVVEGWMNAGESDTVI
jgi:hypothetical protein